MKDDLKWTLLSETNRFHVEKLWDLYKKDPKQARIVYFNSTKETYQSKRIVHYEHTDGNFEILEIQKTTGISVTARIYTREKILKRIVYKADKNRFYYIISNKTGGRIKALSFSDLANFPDSLLNITDYLIKRFTWIRFIAENQNLQSTPFNTFVINKLYNYNNAIRFIYKVPLPVAKMIVENTKSGEDTVTGQLKFWKEQRNVLINIENLKKDFYKSPYFIDSCKMARSVGKKVNCSWSLKRLKLEHDKWSEEINFVLLDLNETRELKNGEVFKKFAEFSGYRLFKTNKELLYEGLKQSHCVGGYSSSVDAGSCGIYHVDGYTLELKFDLYSSLVNKKQKGAFEDEEDFPMHFGDYGEIGDTGGLNLDGHDYYRTKKGILFNDEYFSDTIQESKDYSHLKVTQFRGKGNKQAPKGLVEAVLEKIDRFNCLSSSDMEYIEGGKLYTPNYNEDRLRRNPPQEILHIEENDFGW